ncbi:hypothetical protein RM53_09015 [Brevundimonas nasdae]|uniref:Thioesterase TesA-like domain-containing protein n=1 Tax=Brevundimonas nasdae TaxID=172043 RepID=A0A0B4CNM7_9CAUL|nr:hypothetical protein RM53_09015 [Brevundimonas nasdae]
MGALPVGRAWSAGDIIRLFEIQVEAQPDAVAVIDGQVALTYRGLRNAAAALAVELAASPEDTRPVAAVMSGTVHYAVALLASIGAGRPLVPVDMGHPLERRRAILQEAQASTLLINPDLPIEDELAQGHHPIPVATEGASEAAWPEIGGDPTIGIAFTSGSMGRPKGLAYRQSAILGMVAEHVTALGIGSDDVILSLASLGAGGNQDILSAILTGARVRLLDLKTVGIGETLRVMGKEGTTLLSMIPLVLRTLMSQPNAAWAFAKTRAVSTGGDRLFGKDVDLFRAVLPPDALIRTTQGATETGVVFQWIVPRQRTFEPDAPVPSGYVGPSHAVALSGSETGGDVEDGQPGELMVSGATMAAGAWQGGRLTPGPFVSESDPAHRRVYDSGDIMRRRSDGLFEFVGRRDRQIKMRGLRGDPGEVEAALRRMPDVKDVAVIPRYQDSEAVFVAYVVPIDLYAPPMAAELRNSLTTEVPAHMVPSEIRYLPDLPRLPNYKTNFAALHALDGASQPESSISPEPSPGSIDPMIDGAVRRAWTDILGSQAGAKAFDQAGGDSLKLLQLSLHLEQSLDCRLPLDLFDLEVSPDLLSRRLTDFRSHHQRHARAGLPLVVLCPGMGGDEPRLAAFRRALRHRARFLVIEYPGLETPARRLGQLDALVDDALAQVARATPDTRFRLAGYSAGGVVAFEMARRLRSDTGAAPDLSLIDLAAVRSRTPTSGYKGVTFAEVMSPMRRGHLGGFGSRASNWAFFRLLDLRAFAVLRLLILAKSRTIGAHSVTFVRKVLLEYMRGPAILGWRPSRYDGPVTLYRAETQREPDAAPDLGWAPFCADLVVVDCPGDHLSMLSSPNVEVVADRFGRAFSSSRTDPDRTQSATAVS